MLVDYRVVNGEVTEFKCVLGDWGTAYMYEGSSSYKFMGGTPAYAGPRSFQFYHKDIFSFGRLALELFLKKEGPGQTSFFSNFALLTDQNSDWLFNCFYPQEDNQQLNQYRSQLCSFLRLTMEALSIELDSSSCESYLQSVCENIIREAQNLPPNYTSTSLQSSSTQNTLRMEHNQLRLNLQ